MRSLVRPVTDALRLRLLERRNNAVVTVIRRVHAEHLTYLEATALIDLAMAAVEKERLSVPGIIVEAGTALGGSTLVLAAAKAAARSLYTYDVFGMIPPPSQHDGQDVHRRYEVIAQGASSGIAGDTYYGYRDDLYESVLRSFQRFGLPVEKHSVHLVKGLYEESLHISQPVALAHIDCDWYDSVMTCLRRIEPHMADGGTLIIDDYYGYSGARSAVDDYFKGDRRAGYRFLRKSRLHIKKSPS